MNQLKNIILLMTLNVFLSPTSTFAAGGATGGNGGDGSGGGAGCYDERGQLKTVYYCGAYHKNASDPAAPASPSINDVPSETPADLQALEDFILNSPYFEQATKDFMLKAMKPSFVRKYISTESPPELTKPVVEKIKEEFSHASGIDAKKLELYAVTNTNVNISHYDKAISVTYLLPGFSALAPGEQRVVALFHECLWVMFPDAKYDQIIAAETAFEAAFREPTDSTLQLAFATKMQGHNPLTGMPYPKILALILKSDLDSGALTGFVNERNEFSNLSLFGLANIQCFESAEKNFSHDDLASRENYKICGAQYLTYLDNLRRKYPHSQFLALVGQYSEKYSSYATGYVFLETIERLLNVSGLDTLEMYDHTIKNEADTYYNLKDIRINGESATNYKHTLWSLLRNRGDIDEKTWYQSRLPFLMTDQLVMIQINLDAASGPVFKTPAVPSCHSWRCPKTN